MTVSASLAISPASPASGSVVTATYAVSGLTTGRASTLQGETTIGGVEYEVSETFTPVAASVVYAVPTCPVLAFAVSALNPAQFTATVPAAGTISGKRAVSGSVTVAGGSPVMVSATVTLPAAPVTPPAAAVVPYPAALATGHALLEQYLPADLYAWRYQPGTTIPVVNGGAVTENPNSPRNVTLTTDGGLSVLQLGTSSDSDCGVIQSPGTYPTSSGVIEALIKFSGFAYEGSRVFAGWSSLWLYGPQWPQQGELDAVETQYGESFVSYHYGTGTSSDATTDPWTYAAKTVQLSPKNTAAVPTAPNILPDTWTYVTIAFGKDAASGNYKCDVYYNGTLYCSVDGPFVTGMPMYVTAGTSFGGPVLGSNQMPYDQPGTIEIQYVRVFS